MNRRPLCTLLAIALAPALGLAEGAVDLSKDGEPVRVACVGDSIPILRGVAAETKCDVIDLHTALAPHKKDFPDTVHPNAAGATVIARTVFHALTGVEAPASAPVPVRKQRPTPKTE